MLRRKKSEFFDFLDRFQIVYLPTCIPINNQKIQNNPPKTILNYNDKNLKKFNIEKHDFSPFELERVR